LDDALDNVVLRSTPAGGGVPADSGAARWRKRGERQKALISSCDSKAVRSSCGSNNSPEAGALRARGTRGFRAGIVTDGDVVEGTFGGEGSVDQGVKVAEDGLAGLDAESIHVGDNAREDRGGAGSTINGGSAAREPDDVVVADHSDVGGTATLGVEVTCTGVLGAALEVGGDGGSLPGLLGSDIRETAARDDEGTSSSGADNLSAALGAGAAGLALADGSAGVGDSSGVDELSGTNCSDPGARARISRTCVGSAAVRIGTAVGARVTRGDEEGDTTGSSRGKAVVSGVDVSGRGAAVSAGAIGRVDGALVACKNKSG
jgi:hypothetical protein